MKKNFHKTYNKFLVIFLGLIGFSVGCVRVEYGSPNADFIVNGNVKSNATQQPIENIQVELGYQTTNTDENGNFSIKVSDFASEQTYDISFSDIDGDDNGSFINLDTNVTFSGNFTGGGDGFYEGEEIKNIDIELDEQ